MKIKIIEEVMFLHSKNAIHVNRLGWSILPKVQNLIVSVDFPIHLDPRTKPSEKFSKFFDTYYQSKLVEVLLYDLLYSNFRLIT